MKLTKRPNEFYLILRKLNNLLKQELKIIIISDDQSTKLNLENLMSHSETIQIDTMRAQCLRYQKIHII